MYKVNPAYLAGVMDSDGSITITKRHIKRPNPNYTVMIQLTWICNNKTEDFMKSMVSDFGGSYFIGIASSSLCKAKIIKYCATGNAARKILEYCLKYLVLKKEQAENCFILFNMTSITKPGERRSLDLNQKMEALFLYNKSINSKNKGVLYV